jgi:GDPmannose 4,6-dehydratase
MKTALITGISGQDGSLLADLLLLKGYRVIALSNHDLLESESSRFKNYQQLLRSIVWLHAPLNDTKKILSFLNLNVPDEVYHLGAQSFPSSGFGHNYDAFNANSEGIYNLLFCAYEVNPSVKFFFAGSSEMFGDNPNGMMNEEEKFYPKTMYGISKLVGYELVRNYRDNMSKFALTGILFNHESTRRGEEFVTRKITLAAAKIKLGLQKKLILGSLDSKRDWSAAEDFVEGYFLALQAARPQDYVFSSDVLHTVRDFVNLAFRCLDLNYQDYIEINESFNRPSRYDLRGNSKKARLELNWKPKFTFEQVVERMVRSDFDLIQKMIAK